MENTTDNQDFYVRMAEMVARRYRVNADKSLRDVYQLDAGFLDIATDADFAIRNREQMLDVLADGVKFEQLVTLFVDSAIEFTYASNQFVQIDAREKALLRQIYGAYLRDIERVLKENSTAAAIADGLHALVAGHFVDLRAYTTRFFDRETMEDAQANVVLQKVVCSEYSPEMQLEILGISLDGLVQPVLDLGCGKSGGLVQYLRQKGLDCLGVDRVVEPLPGLEAGDWLEYHLEPGKWGTVISHMAFSNHFVFHHLYRHGSIEPYARQYMAILRSLQVSGSFCYTPGLPFIEVYLPQETYTVTRNVIDAAKKLYASRVQRVR